MNAVRYGKSVIAALALTAFAARAYATDCNSNGIPDTNGVAECGPLEVVILLDTSGSMRTAVTNICGAATTLRDELDALVTSGMDLTYEILDLGTGFYVQSNGLESGLAPVECTCCDSNGVAEM